MHWQLTCRKIVVQILVKIQSEYRKFQFSSKLLNRFFRPPFRNHNLKVFNQFPFRVIMHLCLNTKCKKRFPTKKIKKIKTKRKKKNNKDSKKTTGEKSGKKVEEGKRKTVGFSVNLPCV